MIKRLLGTIATVALLGGALSFAPAGAQEPAPPTIPAEPNIVDPAADANGHSSVTGEGGTPFVGAADFLAIWFTNDADNLYVHIHTTSPAFTYGSIWYSIYVDPGVGADCMEFRAFTEHQAVTATGQLRLTGDCGDLVETVEFKTEEGPEIEGAASGLHTITVPRKLSEHLGDGKVLSGPNALDRYYVGTDATGGIVGVGILDDTEVGTPYTVLSGEVAESEAKKPPAKDNPRGKGLKKGCPKGKGEKKGSCPGKKKKKPAACTPFVPGEAGTEKPLVVLKDDATAEKPVEQTITLDASTADVAGDESIDNFNVQVDTKNPAAGLHAIFEFPARRDYDLLALWPDGSEAASAHLFNTAIEADDPERNHAGESTDHSEHIVGLTTADCGGWTMSAVNWLGEGGEFTIKLWLGEPENEPAPQGGEGESSSLGLFYSLMGLDG